MEATNIIAATGTPYMTVSKKARTSKVTIWYWAVTLIFTAFMLMDGIAGVMRVEGGKEVMVQLGYPLYFLTILGIGKILGAIALVQQRFRTIREWAFAGFTINFLSASASWAFVVKDPVAVPLVALAILFTLYFLWKKVRVVAE